MENLDSGAVEEWTNGSRIAAGATTQEGLYLGKCATVAGAELAGIFLGWERSSTPGTG